MKLKFALLLFLTSTLTFHIDDKAITDKFSLVDSYSFDTIKAVIKEYNKQSKISK